jgi:hypothetical protein
MILLAFRHGLRASELASLRCRASAVLQAFEPTAVGFQAATNSPLGADLHPFLGVIQVIGPYVCW